MTTKIHNRETTYGFEYGSAEVTRICGDEKRGWVVLEVKTPKSRVQIYVTKTGKIRLHVDGQEWSKPNDN